MTSSVSYLGQCFQCQTQHGRLSVLLVGGRLQPHALGLGLTHSLNRQGLRTSNQLDLLCLSTCHFHCLRSAHTDMGLGLRVRVEVSIRVGIEISVRNGVK